jgi:hypothetical protein
MTERSLEDYTPSELITAHRAALEKTRLWDTLISDPATRPEALALVKRKNPAMVIPELDQQVASDKALAAERVKREELEVKVRDLQINARLDKERDRVMKQYGLDEAGLLEVEKLMVDETAPIPHYDAAAKVFKASQQMATPTSSNVLAVKTWDMPEKSMWGKGVGDRMGLDKVFREEAYKAVNELRGGK